MKTDELLEAAMGGYDIVAEVADEGFVEDDLEANLVRDKYARLSTSMNKIIEDLAPNAPDFALREACDQLVGPKPVDNVLP